MDYAMRSLSLFTPSNLSKCVTASMSASASMTQQLLSGRVPRPKPFRVLNADRSVKKGIMADTLEDLTNKASDSLSILCISALVLDEDGTGVDTEEFFQTLPENAVLMALEKGQKWSPHPYNTYRDRLSDCRQQQQRRDVAKLTFDLYKNNPKDFIGCLNVKATLYGVYTVSYDLRCYAAKKMLKEALRWTIFSMQATGHILLGSSCYIEQLLEEEERAEKSLALPQEGRIRQLQNMLLGKISYL
ncbi:cell death activator CIDE-3 [Oreochromis aureus]|uniref:cell death activator CIDE-3 n=1 Tax=Oreochromis aureus TaxID=47969 RepID=UPI0012BD244A|nr:cell death activator CIDE-3 [Oreochromis aureus]XP_031608298.1 cell death activator CIDE-3 [Oreochromis aureus]XP_031608299.1 cell death activator CIDE-3 [Oreochromis aureus]XP_031608300.1 cell death activator CIDE-3 [Oreochromis aureus]XP_039467703.1 cell death activator CIDE-3 [Oreochromis aureus]